MPALNVLRSAPWFRIGMISAWADDLTSLGRNYFFSLNRYLFIAST